MEATANTAFRYMYINVLSKPITPNERTFVRFFITFYTFIGARGGAVGQGTALQAGRSRVPFPMVSMEFFHRHNPSGRTMTLGLTQPLTNEYQEYFLG